MSGELCVQYYTTHLSRLDLEFGTRRVCESEKHTCYHFRACFSFFRLKEPSHMLQIDLFFSYTESNRIS